MTDHAEILRTIRVSCCTLLAHLEDTPAPGVSVDEKQAWLESLCELLGAHQLALRKIQQVVAKYDYPGFGYLFTGTLSLFGGQE